MPSTDAVCRTCLSEASRRSMRDAQQRLHGRRHPHSVERRQQAVVARDALERPLVTQHPDHFLDEERVAARAGDHVIGEAHEGWVGSDDARDHLADGTAIERCKGDLPVVRMSHPWSVELRAEVGEHERAGAWIRLDVLLEERSARPVEPVQILEQHQKTLVALGPSPGQASHHREDAPKARLLAQLRRGVLRVRPPRADRRTAAVPTRARCRSRSGGPRSSRGPGGACPRP